MNGFLYTLTLDEPVIVNSIDGELNRLFYIPGSTVRGAFIQAYSAKKDAMDIDFRRLFLSGETRYLNAYPMVQDTRALPIPLKYRKSFQFSDFGKLTPDKIIALNEITQVNIHTQRDAEKGHSENDAGAVYCYTALPARMKLQGAVLASNAEDASSLRALVDSKTILLGKARTAGYGRANLSTYDLPTTNWRESQQTFSAQPGSFTLTLLSPTIVRDENGQFSLDIQRALEARFDTIVKIAETFCKPEIIDGFNRTWGLPLPQVIAIGAGSMFEVQADVPVEKLLSLEWSGIGERLAEGFGRVAVNLDLRTEDMIWEMIDIEFAPVAPGFILSGDPLVELMLNRILRRNLDEKVIQATNSMLNGNDGRVFNSQIFRWRMLLRDVLPKKDITRVQAFCNENRSTRGWKKMGDLRVLYESTRLRLTEWIELLLNSPAALYSSLGIEPNYQINLGANSIKAEELNTEYRLRLLDAIFAMIEKQSNRGDRNG